MEVVRAESHRGELVLRRRSPDGDNAPSALELRANGVLVVDSTQSTSEVALATAALALVAEPCDVLVAGLGLGFTLQAVLADPRVQRCLVVEIEPALVGWMRDATIPHGPTLIADERITLVAEDVLLTLARARKATYDLVLLDVDNGPGYLVHDSNAALYQPDFLRQTRHILRPGGVLAIWSAAAAIGLETSLREVYDEVEFQTDAVNLQGREETYWLYLARATPAR